VNQRITEEKILIMGFRVGNSVQLETRRRSRTKNWLWRKEANNCPARWESPF